MTKIVFATGNQGKMREIKAIMADMDVEVVSMKEVGICVDIEEDGATFEENALIKARAIAKETDAIVLADDSGLEIDFLDKAPGVLSARYMGEDTPYEVKNSHILDLLKDVQGAERSARFVCSIAAVFPDGREFTTYATIEGEIDTLDSRVTAIASLPEGSTTGDAELIDIRTPATGFHNNDPYSSAGDSVRGQVTTLKGYVDNIENSLSAVSSEILT